MLVVLVTGDSGFKEFFSFIPKTLFSLIKFSLSLGGTKDSVSTGP